MEDIENDGIIEFFHILNNVAMVKGSVITKDGKDRNHSIQFLHEFRKRTLLL